MREMGFNILRRKYQRQAKELRDKQRDVDQTGEYRDIP